MPEADRRLGLFTTDADLVVQTWDGWLARVTGIPAAEAQGRPLGSLVPDFETRGIRARFRRVLAEGVVEILTATFHRYLFPCPPLPPTPHFDRMQQQVAIAPLCEGERIVGTLVTVEDVTARLEAERRQMATAEPPAALAAALGDQDWRIRRAAADGLARHGGPEAVAALLRTLREGHRDPGILNGALQALAMTDLGVVDALAECLGDPDEELRIYAAQALGDRREPQATPALLGALADPSANVRYHAIEALGKLRAPAAVEPLAAVAETRDFFLAFPALEALAAIGDPTVAARLVPLLEDELLRSAVADALGRLGDAEAVGPLAGLLNRSRSATRIAARALAELSDRFEQLYGEGGHIADLARAGVDASGTQRLLDAVAEADGEELRSLAVVLGWLEGPAVERALTRLLGHPAARSEVVGALVRHGPRVAALLLEQLEAEDLEVRQAAIMALGRIGDRGAVPHLVALLGSEPELAAVTAGALAKIGDRQAFEPLLGLLGHDSTLIRHAVVSALNSLGHPAMPGRVAGLLADPDPRVRESAVRIAGYFGPAECLEGLLAACRDPVESVRRAAVEQLPFLEDPRAVPRLLEALAGEAAPVRAAAARGLGHLEAAVALEPLREALGDPDPWVRYAAAGALGRLAAPEALESLVALAQADPAGQVRAAALEALGRIGGARAVAVVAPAAESADPDLARAAFGALGLMAHPHALPPLLAALRAPEAARRMDAIAALAVRGGRGVAGALQWVAAVETDPRVAQAAVAALARLGTPEALAALVALTADPVRREAAVAALARLGTPAVPEVARGLSHPQAVVRRAAVAALARMKCPEASRALTAALEDADPAVRLEAVAALTYLGSRLADRRLAALAHADPDPAVRRAAARLLGR